MSKPLLTVKDVSTQMKISKSTIYRYCKRGLISHIKKNFGFRFRNGDIVEFLEKGRREALHFDNILKNVLTNSPPTAIDKAKGGKEVARVTKARHNYGYGSTYIRLTKSSKSRFYIDYYDRNRRRIQKLVKNATSWQEAHEALKTEILKEHYRECGIKGQENRIKFKDFAELYLRNYAMVKKRAWERSDKVYLHANLIPYFGDFELTKISPLLIEQFIAKRLEDGVKKSTINRDLACLKKMFNKAIDWNHLRENPFKKVKFFSEKDNMRERVIEEEEERRLLKKSAEHLKSIIIVALNTGMRLGEILNLRWNRIDFKAKRIRVEKTKSGKIRFININTPLFEEFLKLRDINGHSPYVFLNPKTGNPLTTINTAFRAACRRAEIKGLRFHDLRRSFATRLLHKGADIETVRDLLGHDSIEMTQRYTHTNDNRKQKAVELLERKAEERVEKGENLLHIRYMGHREKETAEVKCLFSVN